MLKRAIRNEAPEFDFSPFDVDIKCIIVGNYKYIWYSHGKEELFDLESDPYEQNDLSSENPYLVGDLRHLLWETAEPGDVATESEKGPQIDQATKDALKALGYES
jgi:hypothetical protein